MEIKKTKAETHPEVKRSEERNSIRGYNGNTSKWYSYMIHLRIELRIDHKNEYQY
jgi:hypothetical protein